MNGTEILGTGSLVHQNKEISIKTRTFFIWNLIVAFTSSIFPIIDSLWVNITGNLPALLRPGPTIRGICLMRESDARKASYFLAVTKPKGQ